MKYPAFAVAAISVALLGDHYLGGPARSWPPLPPRPAADPAPPVLPPEPAPAAQQPRTPAPPYVSKSLVDMIDRAARRARIPEELLHSVAMVESGYRTDAVSPVGAVGVMQLMPATARSIDVDPYDTKENIEGGARYLAWLLKKYENDKNQLQKALAAYNAGPGAVDRHGGVPPYRETRQYVSKVIRQYRINLAGNYGE